MQATKQILSAVLVFTVLVSGLPLFSPEDANRDTRIDLKDAILRVKDFARSADHSASFPSKFENVLSALSTVAGLKAAIQPPKKTQSVKSFPCLISANTYLLFSEMSAYISVHISTYESIVLPQPTPPPQA